MANKVLLKKSSVAAKVPLTTDLDYGELALNYSDGKLYYKDAANAVTSTWGISITGNAATVNNFKSFGVISIAPNGANANITTAQFITHLTNLGMFNYAHSVGKCSWDYANNNDLTDSGFGTIDLAGCVIETWTDTSNKHVRVTRPTTGQGGFQVLVYNDQGSAYSPGWRAMMTNENIGSYAPSLTGTGASGTWGINTTGNASTVTNGVYTTGNQTIAGTKTFSSTITGSITGNAASVTGLTLNNSSTPINPNNAAQNQIGYASSVNLLNQSDGGLYTAFYDTSWMHQIFGDFRTGQIAVRGKNAGTFQSWRTVLDSSNYTGYAPSLTGTGASGTWGINITGNAASATSATSANIASQVTIHYNDNSNSGYQMLWGSANGVYGTAGIYCNPATDTIYAAALQSTSDERLKTNWRSLPDDFVKRLSTVKSGTYDRIDIPSKQAGSSAQDWQKLLPEVVSENADGMLSLAYGNAALVSAVELAKEVVILNNRIVKLETLVSKLIEG